MRSPRIMPPRKRDSKPGKVQIGLFYRTKEGSVIEATANVCEPGGVEEKAAQELMRAMSNKPKAPR